MASSLLNASVRRSAKGSKTSLPPSMSAQRQAELDSAVDLASCKRLLTSLDAADLRKRLEASLWDSPYRGQYGILLDFDIVLYFSYFGPE